MFVVIRKNNILFLAAIIITSFIMLNFSLKNELKTVFVHSGKYVVVLDAGHGDIDGGAIGKNGSIEKDINLSVCKKLQSYLEKSGIATIITRNDDSAVVDKNGKTVRQIKREDLKYRRDMRDIENADVFISIHMNKFPDEKYKGAQTFYSKTPIESKVLGEKIQKNLIEILDKSNTRQAKQAENSIYILKDSKKPSVIVECGFLSNTEEEKLLLTDDYQAKVAWAIYAGINEYFTEMKQ
jgi:N-acetylmuramoyl-L-alanine amidase